MMMLRIRGTKRNGGTIAAVLGCAFFPGTKLKYLRDRLVAPVQAGLFSTAYFAIIGVYV
ncbi:MAG: hypothetical protein R3C68_00890 [Myxococcota bacterium]